MNTVNSSRILNFVFATKLTTSLLCACLALSCGAPAQPNAVTPATVTAPKTAPATTAGVPLKGAAKVIAEIQASQVTVDAPSEGGDTAVAVFAQKLDAYYARRHEFSEEEAAAGWLSLLAEYLTLPVRSRGSLEKELLHPDLTSAYRYDSPAIFLAMPGPKSWPKLRTLLEQQASWNSPEMSQNKKVLLALFQYLGGDSAGAMASLKEISTVGQQDIGDDYDDSFMGARMSYGRRGLDMPWNNSGQPDSEKQTPEIILKNFEERLSAAETGVQHVELTIPDLASITDEKTARRLILRALVAPEVEIRVPFGEKTLALVKEETRLNIRRLKTPPWRLVDSPEEKDLFEMLLKRFPKSDRNPEGPAGETPSRDRGFDSLDRQRDTERLIASNFYILALIMEGREDDAVKIFGENMNHPSIDLDSGHDTTDHSIFMVTKEMVLDRFVDNIDLTAHGAKLLSFHKRIVLLHRSKYNVETLVGLSLQIGRFKECTEVLQTLLRNEPVGSEEWIFYSRLMIQVLLAAGDVKEAVALMQQSVRDLSAASGNTIDAEEVSSFLMDQGLSAITIGQLLDQKDPVKLGIDMLERARSGSVNQSDHYVSAVLCGIFIKKDLLEHAEVCLTARISEKLKEAQTRDIRFGSGHRDSMIEELKQLMKVYQRAGRHEDILTLLKQAPWWGAMDIFDFDMDTLVVISEALAKTGKQADAIYLLKRIADSNPANDDALQLLAELEGARLLPYLAGLAKQRPFEERPLIWTAVILLKEKRFKEGLAAIEKALKTDPTDGETEAGKRVLAYSVWADLLEKSGNTSQVENIRNIVRSVRAAEKGDEFREAGLLQHSLIEYQKAENLFKDAYCVQWRLAENLYRLGKTDEAMTHYRIVFQNMRGQFGRLASFCFGCEGVFEKKHSRLIAEDILTLAAQNPAAIPQDFYLLGMLRREQGKRTEAIAAFKQALVLDPDYIDALSALHGLTENAGSDDIDKRHIRSELFRLDPISNVNYLIEDATAPEPLWRSVETLQPLRQPLPDTLFPLDAAIQAEKNRGTSEIQIKKLVGFQRLSSMRFDGLGLWPPTPQMALSRQRIVRMVINFLQ